MEKSEFKSFRKKLNKTQKQMSHLLGTSLKAIHSYEQGWRTIPPAVERQMYFLVSRKFHGNTKSSKPCWRIKKCAPDQKRQCPAWEFKSGDLCWFINGTNCDGSIHANWNEKMKICRTCEVFNSIF